MKARIDVSASLALNEAIAAALEHKSPEPLQHDDIKTITGRVNYILDSARSGAFGALYTDHDLSVSYDYFQRIWKLKGTF